MVTIEDARAVAQTLPRTDVVLVRGRVKFRVKSLVYAAFSKDETLMGFAFPKLEREALVQSEPTKFQLPDPSDMRYHGCVVRLDTIEDVEMRQIVFHAWKFVVPKRVAASAYTRLAMSSIAGLSIRPLQSGDASTVGAAFAEMNKTEAQYERYLAEQERNERSVLVAFVDGACAGYVTVVWKPHYSPFPEIQDLNVVPHLRRRGVATALVDAAERIVARNSEVVGIGVGMSADYGAAQRMYVLRGYVPDGKGLTYRDRTLERGDSAPVDDDLILFFSKNLGKQI
jgi:GNAT superfamily N-acetyltransferase